MAHGYLEFFAKSRLKIYSAGIEVHGVNQTAIKIMKEDKIDISNYSSNHVDEYLSIDFDYIITVCDHAKESCPLFDVKDAIKIHKDFIDPSKSPTLAIASATPINSSDFSMLSPPYLIASITYWISLFFL